MYYVDASGDWSGGGRAVLDNLAYAGLDSDPGGQHSRVGELRPIIPRNVPTSASALLHPFVWMPQNALPWGRRSPGEAALRLALRFGSEVSAVRATAMVRISGAIPPLRHARTSPVLHNVLDRAFDVVIQQLSPMQHGSFYCVGSAHSYRAIPSLVAGYARYRDMGGMTGLLIQLSPGTANEEQKVLSAASHIHGLKVRLGGATRVNVAEHMAGSAGVIFPSTIEASPLTLLEALALGKAVACNDIVGHREMLGEHPAEIFATEDPASVARSLRGLDAKNGLQAHLLQSADAREAERVLWANKLVAFLDEAQ